MQSGTVGGPLSGLDELEQVRIDAVFFGRAHAVRAALVYLERGSSHQLCGQHRRVGYRLDLIVVAVEDERRHVELFEVFGEVSLGEGLDAVIRRLVAREHSLQSKGVGESLKGLWPG